MTSISYAAVLEPSTAGAPRWRRSTPTRPSFLIFTSGTESKPKGVVHSVGGFLLGTWANAHWQAGLRATATSTGWPPTSAG